MNTTLSFRHSAFDAGFSTSPGTSPEAGNLLASLRDLATDFENAESLHGQPVRELQDTFLDCRDGNWDGYEALPVTDDTFLRAQAFLEQVLPQFSAPTASATPSGNLVFEWFASPKRRFLVSIGADERIAFAGIFGSHPIHGTTVFTGDVPPEIVHHLKHLFFL